MRIGQSSTKKWTTCTRCGRRMYTDIYHHLCRRCTMRGAKPGGIDTSFLKRMSHFDDNW